MEIRQSERGLALLRMFYGVWLLRGVFPYVVWHPWPWISKLGVVVGADMLASHALRHPWGWVRTAIQQFLLPHPELYAGVALVLGLAAGISLTVGLLTIPGAALAFLLMVHEALLGFYAGNPLQSLLAFQGVLLVVVLLTRAGRCWGVDSVLARGSPKSWLW
ncbi:MAG: hypothetical protein OEW39_01870 [Deltaproteobacteria bacterium]|nr:hypothetical protein [Deltaproteobacteria bacterium]